jgi:hypothetical protein
LNCQNVFFKMFELLRSPSKTYWGVHISFRQPVIPTNNTSRHAGVSLLFINVTFNCSETEAEPRYLSSRCVSMGTRVWLSQITRVTVLRVRDFAGIITCLVASEIFRALDFISRCVPVSSRTPAYAVRVTHFQGNENRRRREFWFRHRHAALKRVRVSQRRGENLPSRSLS